MLPDARDQHRDDGGGGGQRVGEPGRWPAVGDPSEAEVIEEDVARLLVEALRVVVRLPPALEEKRTRALRPVRNGGLAGGRNSGLAARSAPRLGEAGVEAIDTRSEQGQGARPQTRHLTRQVGYVGDIGEIYGDIGEIEGRCRRAT